MIKKEIDPVLTQMIDEFQDWALFDGKYSTSTIVRDVRKIKELSSMMNVISPDLEKVRSYFLDRIRSGAKRQTLNVTRKAMLKWFRFLNEKHGAGISFSIPKFKEPRVSIDWIPDDEDVRKILKFADNQKNRESAARDGAVLRILFSGGLRIGEVAMLNIDDLRENGIFVHSEKGESDSIVGLSDDAIQSIRRYVDLYRRPTDPKALFTGPSGRIDAEYLRQHISILGKKVVPQFHPHAARHWVATALLAGREDTGMEPMDIRFVQTHLRHASLASTQVYTHVDPKLNADRVRERMNKFFLESEINTGPNASEPVIAGPRGFEPPTYGLRVHRST
jgi:integrase/recombinase XerC